MENVFTLISHRSYYRDALYINAHIKHFLKCVIYIFENLTYTMTYLTASNLSLRQRTFVFLFSQNTFQNHFTNVLMDCESNVFPAINNIYLSVRCRLYHSFIESRRCSNIVKKDYPFCFQITRQLGKKTGFRFLLDKSASLGSEHN